MSAAPGRPARRVRQGITTIIVTLEDGTQLNLGDLTRNDLRNLGHSVRMDLGFTRDDSKPSMILAVMRAIRERGEWTSATGYQGTSTTSTAPAAEPITKPQEAKPVQDLNPYPIRRYCPDADEEHASVLIRSAEEDGIFGKTCQACGRDLVNVEPVRIVTVPEPVAVPQQSGTTTVVATDPALLDKLDRLIEAMTPREAEPVAGTVMRPSLTHAAFDEAIKWLKADEHLMLSGEKGTGKSHLAKQLAEALGRDYFETCCTPGMFVTELTGWRTADGTYYPTELHQCLLADGIFGLDEVDNGDPAVIAVLNSLMSGGTITFPDGRVSPGPNFRVISTANTWGTGPDADYVGRVELDAATLNRFARTYVGIDPDLEQALIEPIAQGSTTHILSVVRTIREKIIEQGIPLKFSPSPRDTIRVAKAVRMGESILFGLRAGELAGLPADQMEIVTRGLEVE
jgi:energy-coupling factor transporter ATP-binding protein EcfA2